MSRCPPCNCSGARGRTSDGCMRCAPSVDMCSSRAVLGSTATWWRCARQLFQHGVVQTSKKAHILPYIHIPTAYVLVFHVFSKSQPVPVPSAVCSGQKLHPHGCNFLQWLDQGPQSPLKALPHCSCGQACVLRRVMSIRQNGRLVARCAAKRCAARVWLRPYQVNGADLEPVAQVDPEGPRGRWRRPSAPKAEATGGSKQRRRLVQPKLGSLEVSTATVPCRSYIDEHKK